jgi:hypothetical protein
MFMVGIFLYPGTWQDGEFHDVREALYAGDLLSLQGYSLAGSTLFLSRHQGS